MSLRLGLRLRIGRIFQGGSAPAASLTIAWIDNSSLETGQRIEKRIVGETEWVTALTVAANVESATITGLPFNTEVEIRVIPFNGAGDLPPAETIQVYTAPPSAPTGFAFVATGAGAATASWTLPAVEPVTGYKLRYRPMGAPNWTEQVVATGATTMNFTGLIASERHEAYLTGYNENGDQIDSETAKSATLTITTFAELTSATIHATGNQLALAFSGAVSVGAGGSGGLALTISGGAVTAVYSSGDGSSTLVYTLSRTVEKVETGTLVYVQPGNGIEDAQGNDVASFSGFTITNNSAVVSYLFSEDFEGTPSGWTTTGTVSLTNAVAPAPLRGAQSARLSSAFANATKSFPSRSAVYGFFVVHTPATGFANSIFQLLNAANVVQAEIEFRTDRVNAKHGAATGLSLGAANNVQSVVWFEYVAQSGGGGNGVMKFYINKDSSSEIKPAVAATITTGTGDAVEKLRLASPNTANPVVFDKIRLSATEIGSNPL